MGANRKGSGDADRVHPCVDEGLPGIPLHLSGKDTLFAYLLDPEIEDVIRGAIRRTSTGSFLSLDPSLAHDIRLRSGKNWGTCRHRPRNQWQSLTWVAKVCAEDGGVELLNCRAFVSGVDAGIECPPVSRISMRQPQVTVAPSLPEVPAAPNVGALAENY